MATLLTVSVVPGPATEELGSGGNGIALVASFQPATGTSVVLGDTVSPKVEESEPEANLDEESAQKAVVDQLPAWARLAIGLDWVWEQVRAEETGDKGSLPGCS